MLFNVILICILGRKGNPNRFLNLKQCEKVCLETKKTSVVTEVIVITVIFAFIILMVFVGYKYADYYRSQINYRIFQNQRQVSRSSTGKALICIVPMLDHVQVNCCREKFGLP